MTAACHFFVRLFPYNTFTIPSTPSDQELKFGNTCFVPVLGKISTAMRWHRLEILTTQWCEADGFTIQFLAGWSTRKELTICLYSCKCI